MASVRVRGEDTCSFHSHVERVRREIQERFLRAHRVLQDRETNLLAELQLLLDDYTGEGIEEEVKQMVASKDALIATLKGNTGKDILDQSVAIINTRIIELESKLKRVRATYTSVALEWDELLEKRLRNTGKVQLNNMKSKIPNYKSISQPVAVLGKHSKKDESTGVFCYPGGIAIDLVNNNIYVCDTGNNRVQVFNSCFDFVFLFEENMHGPYGICIVQDKVYVTQYRRCCLNIYSTKGELLHSVGSEGKDKLKFDYPYGLDISREKNRIYVAEHNNDRVQCLNSDLTFNSFISGVHGAKDVKLLTNEIVVLCFSDPCLVIYNYAHESIRHIITRGVGKQVVKPACFLVDEAGNILICDSDSHCLCVFSREGELIRKIGKEGKERGTFIEPNGMAIDHEGRILISSDNPNHAIQLF